MFVVKLNTTTKKKKKIILISTAVGTTKRLRACALITITLVTARAAILTWFYRTHIVARACATTTTSTLIIPELGCRTEVGCHNVICTLYVLVTVDG